MNLIDLHCDTIQKIEINKEKINLKNNNLRVDLNKLNNANSVAQFFALFINTGEIENIKPFDYFKKLYNIFYNEILINKSRINFTKNFEDYELNKSEGKISAFLTIEEGGILEKDINRVQEIYDMGVRLITLTWNYENNLGFPNSKDPQIMNKGLKEFGLEVINKMNELGIVIDVSHLSDGGFLDIAKYSKKPFVASHSNARAITDHPRNLTDEMIRMISNYGGIIGINYYPLFLGSTSKENHVSAIIKHIKHIVNIGGIECMALGSDFDGMKGELGIENISQINKLLKGLKECGFSEGQLEKIWYLNAERIIRDIL